MIYRFAKAALGPGLMFCWRPHVNGVEYVPESSGVIFASNRLSVADELFIAGAVSRHLAFWAKSDYFTGKGFRSWFTRNLVTGLGAIPVERRGGRAALTAFDGAIPLLKARDAVVVYPEGTRSRDGRLYRGRTGVARLAVAASVPIIQVGMIGTDRVQPIGRVLPKLSRGAVTVNFGKRIATVRHTGDRSSLRELTDRVMSEIQKMTGQEYVSWYARTTTPANS